LDLVKVVNSANQNLTPVEDETMLETFAETGNTEKGCRIGNEEG
jgi:hypothetical protein